MKSLVRSSKLICGKKGRGITEKLEGIIAKHTDLDNDLSMDDKTWLIQTVDQLIKENECMKLKIKNQRMELHKYQTDKLMGW